MTKMMNKPFINIIIFITFTIIIIIVVIVVVVVVVNFISIYANNNYY